MQEENNNTEDRMLRKKAVVFIISACIIIAFYFCVKRSAGLSEAVGQVMRVFQPIIIGTVMAFLMNPIMNFFEQYLLKPITKISKTEETAKKNTRAVCSILALLVLVGIVAIFIAIIVPQLIDTIVYLVNHIEEQIAGVLDWANDITGGKYEKSIMNAKENKIDTAISEGVKLAQKYLNYDADQMIETVTTSVIGVVKIVINIIIGMFVSVYILMSRETFKGQIKKIIYAIFKPKYANIIMEVSRKSGDIFYGFIIGKLLDSIIIGIICYVACLIMSMPYAVLVSVIIGVTNIIPVFGPYIGAIPTVIIIFLTSPMQGIYFLIFVLILQQFDGNYLGPKILGNSIGISSFWVVFAVVVGAGQFGVPGMIIGVPIMGIIYYLISRFSKYLLGKKNLPQKTEDYVRLVNINPDSLEFNVRDEEEDKQNHRRLLAKGQKQPKKNKK